MGPSAISSAASAADEPAARPIFVLCPANAVTGGPEVLHQLVAMLRSFELPASILYLPFSSEHSVPQAYRRYDVRVGALSEVSSRSIVVVPETYPWLLPGLPRSQIYFWWLSVDNFRAAVRQSRLRRLLPNRLLEWMAFAVVRRRTSSHLYQSEYARRYAAAHNVSDGWKLSDYLAAPFIAAAKAVQRGPREDIILYNPAKGLERTRIILDQLALSGSGVNAVAIRGMSREEVVAHLARAKLYIDFGNHPGKDRLPREAAALGCCILTNRRGSAANAIDVPIPEEYKIDDSQDGFEQKAVSRIIDICADFDGHAPDFDRYRQIIASEPDLFAEEAAVIFGSFAGKSQQLGAARGG